MPSSIQLIFVGVSEPNQTLPSWSFPSHLGRGQTTNEYDKVRQRVTGGTQKQLTSVCRVSGATPALAPTPTPF